MRDRLLCSCLLVASATAVAVAQQQRAPNNGPKATVINDTTLYVAADTNSSHMAEISAGREMVVVEHNGPWARVFANTDAETSHEQDAPVFGSEAAATPISGWMEAKNVVSAATPKGDLILFGAAATMRLRPANPMLRPAPLSRRGFYINAWPTSFRNRRWRPKPLGAPRTYGGNCEKADAFSLPSAHEKDSYLREQIDETGMRKIEKMYPRSKWSDLAAWDVLDNKICGDWQGSTQCPQKEAEMYEKYAQEHPDSSKTPQALYEAVYRQCVLNDMYTANGDDKKAQEAKARAVAIANTIESKYAESDYAARTAGLIYKLQASIPIYGANE